MLITRPDANRVIFGSRESSSRLLLPFSSRFVQISDLYKFLVSSVLKVLWVLRVIWMPHPPPPPPPPRSGPCFSGFQRVLSVSWEECLFCCMFKGIIGELWDCWGTRKISRFTLRFRVWNCAFLVANATKNLVLVTCKAGCYSGL